MPTLHCGCPSSHLTGECWSATEFLQGTEEFENSPLRLCNTPKQPQSIQCHFEGKEENKTHPTCPVEGSAQVVKVLWGWTYQQPVRDLGGKRMRGGAISPLSNLPSTGSSLGAIMGSRRGRFAEAWPRRFCITKLVTVIRLTGCLRGGGEAMRKQTELQHLE